MRIIFTSAEYSRNVMQMLSYMTGTSRRPGTIKYMRVVSRMVSVSWVVAYR